MSIEIDEKGEMYVDGVSETALYIADDGCNELGLTVEFLIKYVNIYDMLLLIDIIGYISLWDKAYIEGNINDIVYLEGNINDIVYLEGNINRNT